MNLETILQSVTNKYLKVWQVIQVVKTISKWGITLAINFFICSVGLLCSRKRSAAASATVSVSDEFQEWNICLQLLSLSYTRFCKTIYVFNQQLLVIELRRMKNTLWYIKNFVS